MNKHTPHDTPDKPQMPRSVTTGVSTGATGVSPVSEKQRRRKGIHGNIQGNSTGQTNAPMIKPHRIDSAHEKNESIRASGIYKSFRKGPVAVPVLRGVNISVRQGELLAIVGQSGSGKSTLLHLLGTLDDPDQGEIYYEGRRIDNLSSKERDRLRNRTFGMIFQFYHLLPELNVLENVLAPLMIAESVVGYCIHRRRHRRRATEILEMVGLTHRLKHKPRELSGGEMQRAAIARALITEPDLLLADEPTGNLDHQTGHEILEVLHRLNREQNLTIVMVTHDLEIARDADRVVRLVDGEVIRSEKLEVRS